MKFLLLILNILMTYTCYGQVIIKNRLLNTPESQILYIGDENPLEIISDYDNDSIKVISSNFNTLENKTSNIFLINVNKNIKIDTITVFYKDEEIYTKIYSLEKVCDPIIVLGQNDSLNLSKEQILADPTLYVIFPCLYNRMAFVNRFDFSLLNEKEETIYFQEMSGNKLNSQQLNTIKSLKPSSKIVFSRIVAAGSFCPRSFAPIEIILQ